MNKAMFFSLWGFFLVLLISGCQPNQPQASQIPTTPAAAVSINQKTTSTPFPTQLLPSPAITSPLPVLSPTPASHLITLSNASQVNEIHKLGRGTLIAAPAYNLSARLLAVPTTVGIDLYDMDSLELLRVISTYPWNPVYDGVLSFSPDGEYLAYPYLGSTFTPQGLANPPDHATILLWDTRDGSLLAQFPGSSGGFASDLAVSPAGNTLAAGFLDGTVKVFSLPDAQLLYTLIGVRLAYSPDGSFLASMPYGSGNTSNRINLYELANGQLLHQWDGQRASFTPQGQLAVENAGAVRIIDLSDYRVLQAFNGSQAAFSSDGQWITLYNQEKVELYNLLAGDRLRVFEGSYEGVVQLDFSPDGQTLAGRMMKCPSENCVYPQPFTAIWKVHDGLLLQTQTGFEAASWVNFAPNGHRLLLTRQEELTFSDSLTGDLSATLAGYSQFAAGLAFAPDGQTLASAVSEPQLHAQLWDLTSFSPLQQLADPGSISSRLFLPIAFNQDGRLLAIGGDFWSLPDGKRLSQLEHALSEAAHSGPFWSTSVAFSNSGRLLALESRQDETGAYPDTGFSDVALFNLDDNNFIYRPPGPSAAVESLAFSSDGEVLAAALGYPVYCVQLWRVADGQPLLTIPGKEWSHEFTQVTFSPDGKKLATVAVNQDNMDLSVVQLWDTENGAELHQLGATGIRRVAFSAAGDVLASGSYDRLVRLWDSRSGDLIKLLPGHSDFVTDLAFAPDGSILASASADGTIILWGLP